jgi:hypothetical protein
MSTWSELRETVGLPRRASRSATLITIATLMVAGWLLQERVSTRDPSNLDYSEFYALVAEGKLALVVIKGQELDGDLLEPQPIAGHSRKAVRTLAPASDPSLLPLLHDRNVRIKVVPLGPGLLTRLVLGALPLACFAVLALWASRPPPLPATERPSPPG